MKNLYNSLCLRVSAVAVTLMLAPSALAQSLFGDVPDIGGGADAADIRLKVVRILKIVLNFMALVAVVFIVIAGIRLVMSQGEDAEKDKAKKTIFFVIIGLVVILLAQAIVDFVANQIAAG
ncbi:hypothetical protein COU76_00865 [Candidatus Peregrinibacteria bacterium CG10_big_fil_rev_8_21_14_0_10_49_10]|nr:MAG: hypothetical protein COU76_00865 [Candidatus Peregrinibacteria bacterium CG10_big_fil_rev_8_21_14_0_10_49_10]